MSEPVNWQLCIDLLTEEKDLYENVLRTMRQKSKVIVAGKISELDGILVKEQYTLRTANHFSEKRYRLLSRLIESPDGKDMKLKDIIARAPDEYRSTLEALRDELRSVVREIQWTNLENRRLLLKSIEYIQSLIRTFLSLERKDAKLYDNKGQLSREESTPTTVLDFQL
ncbi:MAG: flagellar protein FlgN [Fidelibacterota bacterium]